MTRIRVRLPVWLWVSLAVVGFWFAVAGALAAFGIEIQDPTEGVRGVDVVNDSGRPLRVGVCTDDDCDHLAAGTELVRPGDSITQNVAPDIDETFLVKRPGDVNGTCRELVVRHRIRAHYVLSAMRPCGQTHFRRLR